MLPAPMLPFPSVDGGGRELAAEAWEGAGAALRRASLTALRLGVYARGLVSEICCCDDAASADASSCDATSGEPRPRPRPWSEVSMRWVARGGAPRAGCRAVGRSRRRPACDASIDDAPSSAMLPLALFVPRPRPEGLGGREVGVADIDSLRAVPKNRSWCLGGGRVLRRCAQLWRGPGRLPKKGFHTEQVQTVPCTTYKS